MKKTHQMNVLLVAEESAGLQALRLIKNSGHNLVALLTTVNSPDENEFAKIIESFTTPNRKSIDSSISALAKSLGVQVLDSRLVQNSVLVSWMDSHQIDVLLNVHSLFRICPDVVQAPRVGAFNLHPGPLPAYSGLNVPSWAVYNEEPTHGVTIHHITEIIDRGDIVYETQFPLTSLDTGLTVSIKCVNEGLKLIERLLNDLSFDPLSIPSRPQDLTQRKLFKRHDIPGNGFIQWTDPAHKIDAFIRACNYSPFPSPWGEPKTRLGETEVSILKTEISEELCNETPGTVRKMPDGKMAISTADYWILVGKCRISGEKVIASSLFKDGDKLSSINK